MTSIKSYTENFSGDITIDELVSEAEDIYKKIKQEGLTRDSPKEEKDALFKRLYKEHRDFSAGYNLILQLMCDRIFTKRAFKVFVMKFRDYHAKKSKDMDEYTDLIVNYQVNVYSEQFKRKKKREITNLEKEFYKRQAKAAIMKTTEQYQEEVKKLLESEKERVEKYKLSEEEERKNILDDLRRIREDISPDSVVKEMKKKVELPSADLPGMKK